MKKPLSSVTVFTSNQPRHTALVERLGTLAGRVNVIRECNTVRPGEVADFFKKSPTMQDYFSRVIAAEELVFGTPRFAQTDADVREMPLKMGDLNRLDTEAFGDALDADAIVVFGSSYIKGWLADRLVELGAINIHMGVSPYYRGSSCNFWAAYDGRPELVGATLHRLSHGLDSGPILEDVRPSVKDYEAFELGMRAVEAAHQRLACLLTEPALPPAIPQDRSQELRYTRNADFTDDVAAEWLNRLPTPQQIGQRLHAAREPQRVAA
jgi:hypothetical protein